MALGGSSSRSGIGGKGKHCPTCTCHGDLLQREVNVQGFASTIKSMENRVLRLEKATRQGTRIGIGGKKASGNGGLGGASSGSGPSIGSSNTGGNGGLGSGGGRTSFQ